MNPISLEEIRRIQLDITEALHEFCTVNEIKYSLACGSLLGAIRHNGYIPWDDDMDIYIERKDYNRFIELFPSEYKGIYKFSCLERDKKWNLPFGKLYDNRTLLLENSEEWIPIGINIDIFPLDLAPDDDEQWKKYNKKRVFLRDFINYKYVKLHKNKSLIKNLAIIFIKIFYFFISKRTHSRIVSWYAQIYNSKNTNRIFENIQGIFQKQPFDKSDFQETILHKFEDREFCVMKDYDHCLKCGFGDYMELPPIEKRVTHHSFKAYWKIDFINVHRK